MAHKYPDQLIDKLASFVLHVHRLATRDPYDAADVIVMDENSVWTDMVSATTMDDTGKKIVTVKTARHKKNLASVCLTAKVDGTKLPPFTVFNGAKQETAALDKEIKNICIASSSNA